MFPPSSLSAGEDDDEALRRMMDRMATHRPAATPPTADDDDEDEDGDETWHDALEDDDDSAQGEIKDEAMLSSDQLEVSPRPLARLRPVATRHSQRTAHRIPIQLLSVNFLPPGLSLKIYRPQNDRQRALPRPIPTAVHQRFLSPRHIPQRHRIPSTSSDSTRNTHTCRRRSDIIIITANGRRTAD